MNIKINKKIYIYRYIYRYIYMDVDSTNSYFLNLIYQLISFEY